MHRFQATDNDHWFPERLNLNILNQRGNNNPDPGFEYHKAYASLDLAAVRKDIDKTLTTSQDWWPADYGNYAPFMVRMAWHQAGTYRVADGRGGANTGNQRFAPLNSWPDNGNLDKARRLLWPIKQKYGRKLSWADLFMLAGNQALDIMGLKPFGFGGGRVDIYASETDTYWGPETTMLDDERHKALGEIETPLAASNMGLIYVNPEGPNGDPDALAAAKEMRATFENMAMGDYETVALIAGGHTFGKCHGAAPPESHSGADPESAPLEMQGMGYQNSFGTGKGKDAITSGIEGAWTNEPTKWDHGYFENLYKYEWELIQGPGGKKQWQPKGEKGVDMVRDAHDTTVTHKPMMMTTDMSLLRDPIYAPISKNFYEHPEELKEAFAKTWYKLTHRDMGPVARLLGKEVPEEQVWQDPIPACNHKLIDGKDIESLKSKILAGSAPSVAALVRTAWASASTFRGTDFRGGANGARIRLSPQKDWKVNNPEELQTVLKHLGSIQEEFNKAHQKDGKKVSLADLVVLGGCAAIEEASKNAGNAVQVPFAPGRMDASQEQTDVLQFSYLEPKADGFRNFWSDQEKQPRMREEELMVDKAHLLTLTTPEMTVLVGGLRALNTPLGGLGVFTDKPETLTNDFFVNLLDMGITWKKGDDGKFQGWDNSSQKLKWTGTRSDLIFGSHSELRAIAEYYAMDDAKDVFVKDFVKAWTKVMNLDRF